MAETGNTFPSNWEQMRAGQVGTYFGRNKPTQNNIMTGAPNPLYSNQYQREMARMSNNKNREQLLLQGGWYNRYPKFQPAGSFNTPLNVNGNTFYGKNLLSGGGLLRTAQVQDYYNKILQERKGQLDALQQAQDTGQSLQPVKDIKDKDNIEIMNIDILASVQAISDIYFNGYSEDIKETMLKTLFTNIFKYGLSLKSDTLKAIRDSLDNILFNDELVSGSQTFSENKDDQFDLRRLEELYGNMTPERLAQLRRLGTEREGRIGDLYMEENKVKYFYRIRNLINHLMETKNLSDDDRKLALQAFMKSTKLGQVIGRQVKPKSPEETMRITENNIRKDILAQKIRELFTETVEGELEGQEGEEEEEERPLPTAPPMEEDEEEEEEIEGAFQERPSRRRRVEEAMERPTRMAQRRQEGRGKKKSNWIEFVKKVAKDKKIPYKEALKVASKLR